MAESKTLQTVRNIANANIRDQLACTKERDEASDLANYGTPEERARMLKALGIAQEKHFGKFITPATEVADGNNIGKAVYNDCMATKRRERSGR